MELEKQKQNLWTRVRGVSRRLLGGSRAAKSRAKKEVWLVGMTSEHEQSYYQRAARELAGRPGSIVDLGCWMGSTTLSLAEGIREARLTSAATANDRIYAYDLFRWEGWMDRFLPHVACDYRPGESFLPEVRRRVREFADRIDLIQADLTVRVWKDQAIKLLLVDAMKTQDLARSITCFFYPCLLPDSLLIHQDFKHPYTPWIHLLQFRLRDCFRLTHDVRGFGTTAFQTLREIAPETAGLATDFASFSSEEVDAAMDYSMRFIDEGDKPLVAGAHLMHYLNAGNTEAAQRFFHGYRARGMLANPEFAAVAERLSPRNG
jgi:hypothetical protein